VEQQYHSHRQLLWDVMRYSGFQRHPGEWWHFSLGDHGLGCKSRENQAILFMQVALLYEFRLIIFILNPVFCKTEQRPICRKGWDSLLQTREGFSAGWLILFQPSVVRHTLV